MSGAARRRPGRHPGWGKGCPVNPTGAADLISSPRTTPPLGARLTRSWSRAYTYRLPADIALARRDEIAADLHDHLTDAAGVPSSAVSRAITTRMLLGVPADLSWRSKQSRADRSARRIATAVNASPSPTRGLALACGALLVVWGSYLTAGFLRAGVRQNLAWVMFLSLTLAGVVGLILLARRQAAGAALLAVVALGTTLPLRWTPALWVAGIALAALFVTVTVLQRRMISSPLRPPAA